MPISTNYLAFSFFKWVGALWNLFRLLSCWWTLYVWSYLNFSEGCGTCVVFGRWIEDPVGSLCLSHKRASQAIISSWTSPRSPFPWQCQNGVVSLSDPGNERWSKSSLLQNKEILWFCHLQIRNWDAHRYFFLKIWNYQIKIQWLHWILSDLSKSSAVTVWWQVFLFPETILSTRLVMAGTGDRGGKFPPGLLPEKFVLAKAPSLKNNIPQQKPMGSQRSLSVWEEMSS